MKLLAITVSGTGRALWGVDVGRHHLTNVQCKPIWNSHNGSPLYNECSLTKMKKLEYISNMNSDKELPQSDGIIFKFYKTTLKILC
jgi:hypothetical protein